MKTLLKILAVFLGLVVVAALGAAAYTTYVLPDVDEAPELTVELTAERIQHGEYLANHVMLCMDCHSQRDFTKFAGPLEASTFGAGGEVFDESLGFPGTFYSRNITPARLKDWTDGEIYRTITTGVNKHGKSLFPVMPYKNYAQADPEDIKDVIAYLRTIPAVESEIPMSEPAFPFNFILNTIPANVEQPGKRPDPSDKVAYGRYLANIGACTECHTKPDAQGNKLPGMELAGGWEMGVGNGRVVRTANLTPDKETGLGNWTEEAFVARFKAYADSSYSPQTVGEKDFQTIMPWLMYSKMKEEDLKAIYAYLRTVKPIKHKIEKFSITEPVAMK
ncbi:cytochrome C [Telluribacter sp.]|jgi:mono/diheme cytochrome c family protein|uniref:c-type cytochrome n=1 Tax=Telluribacter sp. TaxID=1978767 RepID=UPI002E1017C5|nr:cytochrome C [Telluribacter sp.]